MADYLLDTNCFLQAAKLHYPLDVAASFWAALAELAQGGRIHSIDRVKNELYTNKDDLTAWCDNHLPTDFWLPSAPALAQYGQLMIWANTGDHFTNAAKTEFAQATNADPWLAALGAQDNCTVVTHERNDPAARKRVMLPVACAQLSVGFCDTMGMFRRLGVRF